MLQTGHPTRWRDRLMCAEDTILRQGFGAIRAVKTCLKGIKSFWLLFFFFCKILYIYLAETKHEQGAGRAEGEADLPLRGTRGSIPGL